MKLLIAIPHYYRPEPTAPFGSLEKDPSNRIRALTSTIISLHQTFRSPHCVMNLGQKKAEPANHSDRFTLDIVICTTQDAHILEQLPLPASYYHHHRTSAQPRYLGFECHDVLRSQLGKYDFFCFLEDDLVIHDALFFNKILWFSRQTTPYHILQPNRYEIQSKGPFLKGYIDGEINPNTTAPFQNIVDDFELSGSAFGTKITFRRTTNPHSGCFFLTSDQMQHWASQPYFLDRDPSFVDPMASAATLGITKTFKVYKPAAENASFLEIEHLDRRYLWQVGTNLSIDWSAFEGAGFQISHKQMADN